MAIARTYENAVRVGSTITTAKKLNGIFTLPEINALFTEIASVVNGKVSIDEVSVLTTANMVMGLNQVINLPDAVDDSDIVPLQQLENLV